MRLSVVIITRNEQSNILNCINSVLKEVHECSEWELIVVDSESSDKTIDIAANHPVSILKVKSNFPSASLGRHVGLKYAKHPYVLFLDGDMELQQGFIGKAWFCFKENPCIAGVIGIRDDLVYVDNVIAEEIRNVYKLNDVRECRHFGGALLAKRDVLLEVGNYDIRMMSNEEPELHSRLLKMGYKIIEIPVPMIIHHDGRGKEKPTTLSRLLSKRLMGLGRGFRVSLSHNSTLFYFQRLSEFLIPIFVDMLVITFLGIFFIFGLNTVLMSIGLEILSLIYCYVIDKPKRFIQAKLLLLYFFAGLLIPLPKVTYTVEQINNKNPE